MVPLEATAAFIVAIITILIHNRKRLRLIYSCYKARGELRKIIHAQNKEDDDSIPNKQQPRVSGIFIHPVKSLRPVSLSETKFDKHGLLADRRLMIVRPLPTPVYGNFIKGEPTHRFFTQRQSPSLATIEASEPVGVNNNKTLIKLSSSLVPNNEHVFINVHPTHVKTLPIRYQAGVWSDTVEVADMGDEAAEFVSKVVCKDDASYNDVRVVSILESSNRKVDELYCPDAARVGLLGSLPQGGLTDGFPILIATRASLDELNFRLAKKGKQGLPMNRFRPNIVVSGTSKPFEEDTWKAIQIGKGKDSVILHITKGCPRCKQSCTDQLTGKRGEEPLETLSDFRALGHDEADVYFAQNAVMNGDVTFNTSMIKVGDPVTILTRGDPVWDSPGTIQAE